ncbi:MATE family efflux transporter [Fodinicurvata sp. EGI_FJ10296]|uniref:MATE family efflux transporter n=1 Tax=Fodinicurvata sp. EGI_FJ10296 TaxID=3231908 RepID=UPI003455BE13
MSTPPATGPETGTLGWAVARIRRHLSELIRLAFPVMVARVGVLSMALVDTVMVGRFSSEELAYQSIGLAPINALYVGSLGLLMGTLVVAANAMGRGRPEEAGAAWRRSMPYAAAIGVAGWALSLAGGPFLALTGQSADLSRGGGEVMTVIGIGLPFLMIYLTTSFFLEGIGRPMAGMVFMIIANLLNIVLNWVLVFGVGPIPPMGATGSAWATTSLRIFGAVFLVAFVWFMTDRDRFAVRRPAEGGWRAWRHQRMIGYAAGASIGAEATAFSILGLMAGWLGVLPLGAFSIALNLVGIVFMVALGIGAATAVRVGNAHGRRDTADMVVAGWTGLGLNTVLMGGIGVVFAAMPVAFAGFYSTDAELLALTAPLIAFAALVLVVDGGQAVVANALRGRADTWIPTSTHILSYFGVMVPVGYLLAFVMDHGAMGLMEAILVASIVSVGLLIVRFQWLAARDARIRSAAAG